MEGFTNLISAFSDLITPVLRFVVWAFPVKVYKLHDGQRGVILTYGRVREWRGAERGPGVVICFCFEEMEVVQSVGGFVDLAEQMIVTSNDKLMIINGMVMYDVLLVKEAMLQNESIDLFVSGFCMNAIREYSGKHSLDEITDSEKLSNDLGVLVNRKLKKYGVKVQNFMITDLRPHEVTLVCDTARELARDYLGGFRTESL